MTRVLENLKNSCFIPNELKLIIGVAKGVVRKNHYAIKVISNITTTMNIINEQTFNSVREMQNYTIAKWDVTSVTQNVANCNLEFNKQT